MNCKIIAFLVVFCAVMLADTDASFRGRRTWRRIKKPLCSAACTYGCTYVTGGTGAPVCGLGCREACRGKKKRDASQFFEEDNGKVVIPLSRDFTQYDSSEDGFIQIEEFAELLSLEPSRVDVKKAFSLADSNDDSLISEVEFQEAPWVFEQVDEYTGEEVVGEDEV